MKTIMTEEYEGQVDHVGNDSVVVIYNVNGGLIEQTYLRSQFLDGKMPKLGTCVRVSVVVTEIEPKPPKFDYEPIPLSYRTPLTGPEEL